jgi:hypothetical protein
MTAPIGSKANPSKYDAYPNLAEDEPYFVIIQGNQRRA